MNLTDLKEKNSIIAELKGENKFQIIEELIDSLDNAEILNSRSVALKDVLDREQYLSTGLENGVAIPHGKTDSVSELAIAFGISRTGTDFESLDGKPAHLIFLVLSPKDTSGPHIQFLAKISRNLKQKEFRDRLFAAQKVDDIQAIFDSFE